MAIPRLVTAILGGPLGFYQLYLLRSRGTDRRASTVDLAVTSACEEFAQAVIAYCRHYSISPDFPVELDDSISHVYGIVSEDLADMVVRLCDQCAVSRPSATDFRHARLETVRDMIEFIARQPPL